MKNFLSHARMYIFRGLFAIIPLGLTVIAIRLVYVVIDRRIIDALAKVIGYRIPGLGVLLVLVLLYFLGLVTSNVLGRRLFHVFENIFQRIPLINTTYQVGKQISTTLSLPERQLFKKAVLIDFFRPGERVIGFVTGTVNNEKTREQLLKIFIPTVPNPTSGFLVFMKESETFDPGWSIDEAMKTVISGGIIGPEIIRKE